MPHLEILLVDDDPLIRHVIADELEEAGHFVTTAVGPEAAIETLHEHAAFDIIVIDYTMPGMSGGDLARHIRQGDPQARLAILTGNPEAAGEQPCPVLTKGIRMSELVKAIEAVAAGRDVMLAHDAASTRVDLLVDQIATKPAVGGVRSAIGATYGQPAEGGVPDAFASILDRMPEK